MNLDHITKALAASGVQANVLAVDEKAALLARLQERLSVDVRRSAPWDDPSAPDGIFRPDGWALIPNFIGEASCFMFLDGAHIVWYLPNGAALFKVLKECPPMEFYVCGRDADYLICSNHHDFVIGWGTAKHWVQKLESM